MEPLGSRTAGNLQDGKKEMVSCMFTSGSAVCALTGAVKSTGTFFRAPRKAIDHRSAKKNRWIDGMLAEHLDLP